MGISLDTPMGAAHYEKFQREALVARQNECQISLHTGIVTTESVALSLKLPLQPIDLCQPPRAEPGKNVGYALRDFRREVTSRVRACQMGQRS